MQRRERYEISDLCPGQRTAGEKEHGAVAKELELKREVNRKLISLLETMDIDDKGSSEEVKKMVGTVIEQLNEDSFVAAVNPEDIVPMLR